MAAIWAILNRKGVMMIKLSHGIARLVCCMVIGWLAGCRTTPPAPPPPQMLSDARLYAGTPISGPLTEAPRVAQPVVRQVNIRWIVLHDLPADTLAPINAQSRLIIAPDTGTALPAGAMLTRAVRFGSGDQAAGFAERLFAGELGEWQEIAADSRLVVPGATVQLGITPVDAPRGDPPPLALLVSPGSLTAATTQPVEILAAVQVAERITAGPRGTTGRVITETAIIDAEHLAAGMPYVIAWPLADNQPPWNALVAIATVASPDVDPVALDDLQAELLQSAERVKLGLSPAPLGDVSTLRGALSALNGSGSPRPALLLLANLCDARIAGDVALVADDSLLASLAAATRDFTDADTLPALADLQWFLDRTALQALCQSAEKETLSPELQSVLALHTGDVARRPDAILAMLEQVGDSESLRERIVAENFIALEDTSPAARVRAYDWLAARNRAPADFDPLADARARRAAIDQAMTQLGDQP